MTQHYIAWFGAAEAEPHSHSLLGELGGKGQKLAKLSQIGLPIPQGFVLLPHAFTESLAVICDPHSIAGAQSSIPRHLTGPVLLALQQALAKLCPRNEPVAVRSSAIEEDGAQRSYAGQLESFLGVLPEQAPSKVIEVWRSAFSAHLQSYRNQTEAAARVSPPAVLIQRFVNADASGVAFGADPVSGKRSVTVINAVYGLASALVGGEQAADTYIVDRSGRIVDRQIVHKPSVQQFDPSQPQKGIQTQSTPPDLSRRAVLTDSHIGAIARLVRQVNHHFGRPQDIEWAIADDMLYLLQSRAITTLTQTPDPDGQFNLWDNSNIVESYNGVTTPLTFSFARKAYTEVYQQFCRFMGVSEAAIAGNQSVFRCMIGLIQGRIYYNLLNWYRILALLPGARINARFMEQMMGVRESLPESVVAELQQGVRSNRLQDGGRLGIALIKLVVQYLTLPRRIQGYYQRLDRLLQRPASRLSDEAGGEMRSPPFADWRADELVAHYRRLEQELLAHWDAPLINDFFAMIFYGLLRRLTTDWCGDQAGTLQNQLLAADGDIISAEPARRMQRMADLVDHPDWLDTLCQGSQREILQRMPDFPQFKQAYEDYLDQFGDRCLEELKLESPTLHDDPFPLLRTVGQLAQRAHAHPQQNTPSPSSVVPLRTLAEQQVRKTLARKPLRRWLLGWVAGNAQRLVRNRENLRFERTRVFGQARRLFVELGKRYYALDLLDNPQDVFYLEVEEILAMVEGTSACTDLKALAAIRRNEFDRYRQMSPPSDRFVTYGVVYQGNAFQAKPSPESPETPSKDATTDLPTWQGVGCSPGYAQTVVRVINNPQQALTETHQYPRDERPILVAKSTDPGWVLLFPHASGLLVERGSVLSHVAIVARELGLPMISGLSGITEQLQDGDRVELDGRTGRVRRIRAGEKGLGDEGQVDISES